MTILNDNLSLKGTLKIWVRDTKTKKVLARHVYCNTILTSWMSAVAASLVAGNNNAKPRVIGFSRDVIAASPEPTDLDAGEFRASTTVFCVEAKIIMIGVLGPADGNGAGNIKSCGFFYGSDATVTVGTGTMGSILNNLNVSKDSSMELSFQYDIEVT